MLCYTTTWWDFLLRNTMSTGKLKNMKLKVPKFWSEKHPTKKLRIEFRLCRDRLIMTKISTIRKVVRLHQHAKFQVIPPMHSPKNDRKPLIWPITPSENGAKMRKIRRSWPKPYQHRRWSGHISMPNFRQFLPCLLQKMPRNPKMAPK